MTCTPVSAQNVFDDGKCFVETAVVASKPKHGFAAAVAAVNFVKTVGFNPKSFAVVTALQHINPVFANHHRYPEAGAFFENIVALAAGADAGGTGDVSVIAAVFQHAEEKTEMLVVIGRKHLIGLDILGVVGDGTFPVHTDGDAEFFHHVAGMHDRCRQTDEGLKSGIFGRKQDVVVRNFGIAGTPAAKKFFKKIHKFLILRIIFFLNTI